MKFKKQLVNIKTEDGDKQVEAYAAGDYSYRKEEYEEDFHNGKSKKSKTVYTS